MNPHPLGSGNMIIKSSNPDSIPPADAASDKKVQSAEHYAIALLTPAQAKSTTFLVSIHRLKHHASPDTPLIAPSMFNTSLDSTLPGMTVDPDLNTRISSSRAMVAAARDYNGRKGLLEVNSRREILWTSFVR